MLQSQVRASYRASVAALVEENLLKAIRLGKVARAYKLSTRTLLRMSKIHT